jgi:uncharacterized protein YdhG (YjbR/CyaY superfamily)
MKKPKFRKRTSAAKPKPAAAPKTIDDYLAAVPEPAHTTLQKVRAAIRSALPPGATETISYKIPAFKHGQVIIWFAAFANHCSIFPGPLINKMVNARLAQITSKRGR